MCGEGNLCHQSSWKHHSRRHRFLPAHACLAGGAGFLLREYSGALLRYVRLSLSPSSAYLPLCISSLCAFHSISCHEAPSYSESVSSPAWSDSFSSSAAASDPPLSESLILGFTERRSRILKQSAWYAKITRSSLPPAFSRSCPLRLRSCQR